MSSNYLIGIGGTGAKMVESFVMLAACGLAPEKVELVLIDQDASNGNLNRTRNLLAVYNALHTKLRLRPHKLGSDCRLLHTELGIKRARPWHTITNAAKLDTLYGLDDMPRELKLFYKCLFSRDDRKAKLDVGFRGRPALGASAYLSRYYSSEAGFMSGIANPLADLSFGEDVNIYLAGSIFGGTGASGLPNVAKVIRAQRRAEAGNTKLRLGAGMLLPYFAFGSGNGRHRVVVEPDTIMERTKQALNYYDEWFREEDTPQGSGVFDSLHFLGWDPLIRIDYFEPGKRGQENPSFMPELLAALAASRFFARKQSGNLLLGREEDEQADEPLAAKVAALTWEDVPQILERALGTETGARNALGSLVRFAFAYHYIYHPHIKDLKSFRRVKDENWARRLLPVGLFDLKDENTRLLVDGLDDLCVSILRWAAAVSFFTGNTASPPVLFNADVFSERPKQVTLGQPTLKTVKEIRSAGFPGLVAPESGTDLAWVFDLLHKKDTEPVKSADLGRFFGSLYQCCRL